MSQNQPGHNDRLIKQFPRATELPSQSPLFWVSQKDRYLRQLLITDIEALTKRRLIVYYTDCAGPGIIDWSDPKYLGEMLHDAAGQEFDLMIETNGGQTDATEAVVSLLLKTCPNFRVIVPYRAKSNGTLMALAAASILMGEKSELGPVDPNLVLNGNQQVPCFFIVNSPPGTVDPIMVQVAVSAIQQTQKLASTVLAGGMMKGKPQTDIDDVVQKLSTRATYHSHGSVIDHIEASALGLNVTPFKTGDPIWDRLWLLRCMLDHDARRDGYAKIFETSRLSHSIVIQ